MRLDRWHIITSFCSPTRITLTRRSPYQYSRTGSRIDRLRFFSSEASRVSVRRLPMSSVNLSKVSLKRRLESFYSVVAPELLPPQVPGDEWLGRFDEIYKKYGGTPDSESSLQSKLSKKYGSAILLTVVPPPSLPPPPSSRSGASSRAGDSASASQVAASRQSQLSSLLREPSDLSLLVVGSGDVSFTSSSFDAYSALLRAVLPGPTTTTTTAAGAPLVDEPSLVVLDNVEKCRSLLPVDDPFYLAPRGAKRGRQGEEVGGGGGVDGGGVGALPPPPPPPRPVRRPTPFDSISSSLSTGPMSLLSSALTSNARVTVMVRYVNCVRGTITGTILAFDKHFNILLAGAEETYSRRYRGDEDCVAREAVKARNAAATGGSSPAIDSEPPPGAAAASSSSSSSERSEEEDGHGSEDDAQDDGTTRHCKKTTSTILSPSEIETSRRKDGHGSGLKTRKLRQVLIKGDMVVSCWLTKD